MSANVISDMDDALGCFNFKLDTSLDFEEMLSSIYKELVSKHKSFKSIKSFTLSYYPYKDFGEPKIDIHEVRRLFSFFSEEPSIIVNESFMFDKGLLLIFKDNSSIGFNIKTIEDYVDINKRIWDVNRR